MRAASVAADPRGCGSACAPYTAGAGSSASCYVTLSAGQTLAFGTANTPNSRCSGDTYLYLYSPSNALVVQNDDAVGVCSYASYKALTSGSYRISEACYSYSSCSGTVGYTITTPYTAPVATSAVSASPPPSAGVTAAVGGTTWSATATPAGYAPPQTCQSYQYPLGSQAQVYNSALNVGGCSLCAYSVATCGGIQVNAGQTLIAGTTNLGGAACTGDTMLWLQSGDAINSAVLASSDNYGSTSCSFIQWTATSAMTVYIREGCVSAPTGCGGTVRYSLSGYVAPPPPSPPLPPLPTYLCSQYSSGQRVVANPNGNTAYNLCQVQLTAGVPVTVATTGLTGAQCSGSTYLWLVQPSSSYPAANGVAYQPSLGTNNFGAIVASNGNSCASMTYTAPTSGNYVVLEGCYGGNACSATVGVQGATITAGGLVYPPPPPSPPPMVAQGQCAQFFGGQGMLSYGFRPIGNNPTAGVVWASCSIPNVQVGNVLTVSTVILPGTQNSGPTYLWLLPPGADAYSGSPLVSGTGNVGVLTWRAYVPGTYTLLQGCSGITTTYCSGTAAWITSVSTDPMPPAPLPSPPPLPPRPPPPPRLSPPPPPVRVLTSPLYGSCSQVYGNTYKTPMPTSFGNPNGNQYVMCAGYWGVTYSVSTVNGATTSTPSACPQCVSNQACWGFNNTGNLQPSTCNGSGCSLCLVGGGGANQPMCSSPPCCLICPGRSW